VTPARRSPRAARHRCLQGNASVTQRRRDTCAKDEDRSSRPHVAALPQSLHKRSPRRGSPSARFREQRPRPPPRNPKRSLAGPRRRRSTRAVSATGSPGVVVQAVVGSRPIAHLKDFPSVSQILGLPTAQAIFTGEQLGNNSSDLEVNLPASDARERVIRSNGIATGTFGHALGVNAECTGGRCPRSAPA
jgi:hypothetical protein